MRTILCYENIDTVESHIVLSRTLNDLIKNINQYSKSHIKKELMFMKDVIENEVEVFPQSISQTPDKQKI
jgi:hypothetical protein